MNRTRTILIISLLQIAFWGKVDAQETQDAPSCSPELCSRGNDPTPAGVMISHVHPKNSWMVSYRHMSTNMGGLQNGTAPEQPADVLTTYTSTPDLMRMKMHMVMAMYGVTGRLTLMGMFTYNSNYMEMTMPVGKTFHRHSMGTKGPGDTRLFVLYSIGSTVHTQWLMSIGANFPTGKINYKGESGSMMYPSQRFPYCMQAGSGTYDLLPGINYLFQENKLTYAAQLSSVIRPGFNRAGYNLGNEVSATSWLAWQVLPFMSTSLRIEGVVSEKIKGMDTTLDPLTDPTANTENYGGQRVFIFPGITFQLKNGVLKNHRLGIEFGLPVYQNLNGTQMKQKSALNFSWSLNI